MKAQAQKKTCRQCQTPLKRETDPKLGPFCSERCQQADLMEWFGESYKVTRPLSDEDLDNPDLQDQAVELRERFGILDPYDPRFS